MRRLDRQMKGSWRPRGWVVWLWGCLCGLGAVGLPAAELPRAWVTTDAAWVFHLDLESLRGSELHRHLQAQGQAEKLFRLSFPGEAETFQLDFMRCQALTLFGGMDDDEDSWVGLLGLPGTYRQEILGTLERLSRKEDSAIEKIEENKAWNGFSFDDEVFFYSPRRDLIVLGEEDAAEHACAAAARQVANEPARVLEGWNREPGALMSLACLRGDDDVLLPDALSLKSELSGPWARAHPQLTDALAKEVLGVATRLTVSVGEATNRFWLRAALQTSNAAAALTLRRALTNLTASANVLLATNATWERIARNLEIAQDRAIVRVSAWHPLRVEGRSIYEDVIVADGPPRAPKAP